MEYEGPTRDDLANINALNRSFLVAMSDSATTGFGVIAERRLTDSELSRLASAPFLLFSLREHDGEYWEHILEEVPQIDLIHSPGTPDDNIRQLQMASLGFLWQLSRRNPYAARIVSGAPVSWCERLADRTLVTLLQLAATRNDLLSARFADDEKLWRRLLGNGISARYKARLTSHQCALQAMLTRQRGPTYSRVSAAACTMQRPVQRDAPGRAVRDPKV
ncbi:MAG: hypothetical protein GY949_21275 [Gammaproteobacteria bacterium]|nr:hypothetical protein [Gammaproteobacteria bacterium]